MSRLKSNETLINIKKTWKYARSNKKAFVLCLIFCVLLSAIGAIIPILDAKIILNLTDGVFKELIIVALAIFGIEIFRNLCRFFLNKFWQILYRETLISIQSALSKEMVELEVGVIDKNSSGVFIDRLNKDASDLSEIFNQINDFLSDFLANIGVMVAIFIISKIFFIFFLVGIIIIFILQRIRMKLYFERDKKFRELSEKNTGLITELIRGIKDIKVLNASKSFINKTYIKLKESNQERYKMNKILLTYNFITNSLKDLLILMFIVLSIILINMNLITIASVVILYMYQSRVYNLLYMSSRLTEVMKKFNLSSKRVYAIIESDDYKKESFGASKLSKVEGNFEFKNVTFSYEDGIEVLKDVSFKIKANETVGFVGKSGSGKSTIFSLLTKMYTVNQGKILIDNVDINELTKDSIRNNISIITQNPYIFNFSIRENLSIVKKSLTEKEMIESCKLACIHDYIKSLPEGYDTVVGEGGLILSGGQRQRLAIARALIKQTEIILFDEATSALDNETQKEIQNAINNMKKEKTILIIAHRLSTIIDCDRIILIDNGKIIAEGTHKNLLKTNNLYKKLYETEITVHSK